MSAAEDAAARAKEITARLSGTAPPPTTNSDATSSSKRKRWGVAPEAEAASGGSEALPGLQDAAKRFKAAAEPVQRRIWVDTDRKPNTHFVSYLLNDGDKLKGLVQQLGEDNISIELKGRGSSKTPPVPGMPEEPLHVLIQGPPDVVAKAEPMVEDLLKDADAAPLQEDPSAIADKAADALAAVAAAASNGAPGYKPAPVAALIHGNSAGTDAYGPAAGEMMEEQIGVPNGVVGFIIGRGGENISSMQARTGCKVQIQKEHEMTPGQTQRVITLTAASMEAIDQCRSIIEEMVADRIRTTGSSVTLETAMQTPGASNPQAVKLQEALASGHALVKLQVPDGDVGLIIGKAGSNIKGIQDRSGANVQIPPAADSDNSTVRTVSITHPHPEGAQMAKKLIEDLLASKTYSQTRGPYVTMEVPIPDRDVGMCIGRSGCVIREMQNKTGTKIQIPSVPTPGQTHRIATVQGPAEGCNQVKQMIERISLEQSSQSVMAGTAYQNQYNTAYGGQQYGYGGAYQQQQQAYGQYGGYGQQQHGGGQQDYPAEWASYYAEQGAAQGGGAVAAASASASAPAASSTNGQGQPASDAYYEQFFRYAYYYGEDAARKYYGAWSPPVGTPNPYGTNPNGITAAPPAPASAPANSTDVAASAPAPQAASAAAPPAAESVRARDTGVRKVSNLPAWMTKGTS